MSLREIHLRLNIEGRPGPLSVGMILRRGVESPDLQVIVSFIRSTNGVTGVDGTGKGGRFAARLGGKGEELVGLAVVEQDRNLVTGAPGELAGGIIIRPGFGVGGKDLHG